MLKRLLKELIRQETGGLFTYSIVVADNDEARSAEATVEDFRVDSEVPITYCVEPRRNIALARNKVVWHMPRETISPLSTTMSSLRHFGCGHYSRTAMNTRSTAYLAR